VAKHNEKFDPNEVPDLLDRARKGDIVARDELLYRFQRLIATLVNVCITGRPNFWSSYQKTFLRMFTGKDVPIQNTASMLKKELANFEKEELFSTGQLAVLLAIERCETNLASTIVICFKDLIHKMIKDPHSKNTSELDEYSSYEISHIDDDIALDIFIEDLNAEESKAVEKILSGEKTEIPESLREKFGIYLDR
jgi:hypothetical protein